MTVQLPSIYSNIKRELAKYISVPAIKEIADKARAMEVYAFQARDGEIAEYAVEIRKRATRRLGELMAAQPKAKGRLRRGVLKPPREPTPTLASQGIDKELAKRARKAAAMSEKDFDADVAESKVLAKAAAESNQAVVRAAREKRHSQKSQNRKLKERRLAEKICALPDKKYAVILADPEWKFEVWSNRGMMNTAADNHYPTSATAVIKARNVESIAADDAVLFLWATVPMLPQALEVMAAWGFTYKTHICWKKDKAGTGYWFRNQHELLLLGTRGKIPAPSEGMQASSIIEAPTSKHSQKPEAVYHLIEKYFPNLPKIELNARNSRNGWDAWGNEIDDDRKHEPALAATA